MPPRRLDCHRGVRVRVGVLKVGGFGTVGPPPDEAVHVTRLSVPFAHPPACLFALRHEPQVLIRVYKGGGGRNRAPLTRMRVSLQTHKYLRGAGLAYTNPFSFSKAKNVRLQQKICLRAKRPIRVLARLMVSLHSRSAAGLSEVQK